MDSWGDTGCTGRFAYVEKFVDDTTVIAAGFANSLGKLENLPLDHAVYAYDMEDRQTVLLEHNSVIYLGDQMDDSLANPIKSEEFGIRMNLRPRKYYPDDESCQSILLDDGTEIPILNDGVLPYVPVRRPTSDELDNCHRIALTSRDLWDPFLVDVSFTRSSVIHGVDIHQLTSTIDYGDPISAELMPTGLDTLLLQSPLIHISFFEEPTPNVTIKSINSYKRESLSVTELSKLYSILAWKQQSKR